MNTLNLRKILLFLGDAVCLYLALLGMVFFGFWNEFNWEVFSFHLIPFSILYLFWLIIFYTFGLYDLKITRTSFSFYPKFIGATATCLVLGIVFFYLTPFFEITPRTNLALNILIFGILFGGWRKLFYLLFSSRLLNRIAIVGKNSQLPELTKEIIARPYLGYNLVTLDLNQNLFSQIQEKKIDTLIVPTSLNSNSKLSESLYQCLPARISFINWTHAYESICEKVPVSLVAQTWFLENLREGEKILYDNIKKLTDLILASTLLLITFPLWLLIALAIKLEDKGPIFYRQKRIGKDKNPFSLFKFRSMRSEAEKSTGPVWAQKDDSRVTKVGKILRNTHLDELPQMINVLKGELSLVGPRPERPEFVEQLEKEVPHYHIRHLIKPGFTGWAQTKFRYGRSITDSQEKLQYDLYYLKNRNPLLDLGILLKTLQFFFKKE